jgi:hypothetical protein
MPPVALYHLVLPREGSSLKKRLREKLEKKRVKPIYHVGQEIVDMGCGCQYIILSVGSKYYNYKHYKEPDEEAMKVPFDWLHDGYKLVDPDKPCPYCKEVHKEDERRIR